MNPARRTTQAATTALVLATAGTLLSTAAPAASAATTCTSPVYKRQFFANTAFSGTPKRTDCDAAVAENWGGKAPATGLPKDNFGVRWTVTRDFGSGGPFAFTAAAQDGIRVYVDGKIKVNVWKNVTSTAKKTVNLTIPSGKHTLRVDYANWTGNANVNFAYAPRTSAAVDKVKPLVPTAPTVTYDKATGKAKLTWAKNKEMDLAGYKVYRRLDGASFGTRPLATTASTSYTDPAVPKAGKTFYEVRAYDKAGNQSAGTADLAVTTEDLTPPPAVTGLTATPTEYGFRLRWNPNPAPDLFRYVVYGGYLLRGDEGEQVCSVGPVEWLGTGTTSYSYVVDPDGEERCFFIDAVDDQGNSHYEWTRSPNLVIATELDSTPSVPTPEGSPLYVTVSGAEDDEGNEVRWSGLDANSPEAAGGYHVYRWNPAASTYEKIAALANTASVYVDTGARRGTTSYYWVTAVAADGTESVPAGDWTVTAPAN
ncbi:fibronectin type III domain-containing protein [Streptomyces sp. NPDC002680]|uniref:fibronectin type III domain-containing protein n=1 Tax=Streptomyces sp. NPDC002680 TaxID=3364659 RepID=UPI0036ABDEB6